MLQSWRTVQGRRQRAAAMRLADKSAMADSDREGDRAYGKREREKIEATRKKKKSMAVNAIWRPNWPKVVVETAVWSILAPTKTDHQVG